MKKILALTVALGIAALPLSARELKFYNGNTPINSGAKIEMSDYEVENIGNMVSVGFAPELYVWSDIFTNTVTLTATCVSGQTIQFCPGGECVAGTTVSKDKVTISSNQKIALLYEYMAELSKDEPIPTVVTEISAFDTKYTSVKADVTIVMSGTAGVTEVFVNDDSFKAVAGGIEYDFAAPTQVVLCTLAGATVIETTLEGSGVLSTASVPEGLYVYKAGEKSGKIYIR